MIRAFVMAALLAGCGAAPSPSPTVEPTPAPIVITGTFTLHDPGSIITERAGSLAPTTACAGTGGYSDIAVGLGVVVTDQDGRTIGTGRLTHDGIEDVGDEDFCAFAFTVPVADPAEFYAIEVGSRGELTYSHEELESMGWEVTATLGE